MAQKYKKSTAQYVPAMLIFKFDLDKSSLLNRAIFLKKIELWDEEVKRLRLAVIKINYSVESIIQMLPLFRCFIILFYVFN